MLNSSTATPLIQTALNALQAHMHWANQAFARAQRLGLQGEKRRERHEARKDYMGVNMEDLIKS